MIDESHEFHSSIYPSHEFIINIIISNRYYGSMNLKDFISLTKFIVLIHLNRYNIYNKY